MPIVTGGINLKNNRSLASLNGMQENVMGTLNLMQCDIKDFTGFPATINRLVADSDVMLYAK